MIKLEWNIASNLWKKNNLFDIKAGKKDILSALNTALSFITSHKLNIVVSILMTDNDQIQELNKAFRNKDKPTNVLSFPYADLDVVQKIKNHEFISDEIYLGELIFGYETIALESKDKLFHSHLMHLAVHGFLHLFGFDHENDEDAEEMESMEIRILEKCGIGNPYLDMSA